MLALYSTEWDRHDLVVERRTVRIRRLPAPFQGLKLAQISDFHFHSYAEDWYLREVVRRVNALGADVVALTGDFITAKGNVHGSWRQDIPVCAEILSGLTAPLRLCTLGNHDTIDVPLITKTLEAHGLPVLHNAHLAMDLRGERLWLAGLADAYFDRPDLDRAIPVAKEQEPVILLGHEPDYADTVAAHGGVDLMLTGHSHGGQVRLPGLTPYFLPKMGQKYVEGMFDVGGLQLYVNRGIGAVHLPVRFRCPPEITLLTLEPA